MAGWGRSIQRTKKSLRSVWGMLILEGDEVESCLTYTTRFFIVRAAWHSYSEYVQKPQVEVRRELNQLAKRKTIRPN